MAGVSGGMKILVANLGSTSLKYRLFDFGADGDAEAMVTRGGIERVTDYAAAVQTCLDELQAGGFIRGASDLAAVGFKTIMARGVSGCVRIDDSVLEAMEFFRDVAPAHNPPYLTGIRLFQQRMPEVPLVALFETAFYQWAPEAAMRYAVPADWHAMGVRRWGFHGASHKFIAERSAELLGRDDVAERARALYVTGADKAGAVAGSDLRVISCHLGGSSSVTGIRNGVAVGNSMGMSPQSGLPQNNRVGDLDAFALPFVMRHGNLTVDQAREILCNDAGLKGVSGGLNDVRDLAEKADGGHAGAALALDLLSHQTRHWIGAYLAQLNGADALVFTAGIGENRAELRASICADLDQLGIELDPDVNASFAGGEGVISKKSSRVKIMVIPTNEELVVAREVRRFLTRAGAAAA